MKKYVDDEVYWLFELLNWGRLYIVTDTKTTKAQARRMIEDETGDEVTDYLGKFSYNEVMYTTYDVI